MDSPARQMKMREGWSTVGWCAACALLCVHAWPARDRRGETYIENVPGSFGGRSAEAVSAARSSETIGESPEEFEEKGPSTVRAIATQRTRPVLLPLILEPEAEMLPVGYAGVKSPGVSHMELTLKKPQIVNADRYESTLEATMTDDDESSAFRWKDDDPAALYDASKYATQITRDDRDSLVKAASRKSGSRKQRKKAEHGVTSAERGNHSRNENRARDDKEDVTRKKGAAYEAGDGRRKAHNAAGYHGVYHVDEFEKDYHDNGGRAGHFEGRYGERRAAAGTYADGKKNDSGSIEMEADEREE